MKWFIALQISFVFIIPIALIYFGILPFEHRIIIIGTYSIFAVLLVVFQHWSPKRLGIRTDNLREVLVPYIIFTLLSVAVLVVVAHLLEKRPIQGWYTHTHLLFLFLPSSITQEFLYRGFLMEELARLKLSILYVLVVNSILFTLLHVIYDQKAIILPLVFASGVGFAWMYHKYPNLIAISASHAILNLTAVIYTFF
ncbi:MAG: type II CAAX endopeptidase family protein [Parcubacteria group bacterium]